MGFGGRGEAEVERGVGVVAESVMELCCAVDSNCETLGLEMWKEVRRGGGEGSERSDEYVLCARTF